MTRRGVIDIDMAWNQFCWEVVRYYVALTSWREDCIGAFRSQAKDCTLYTDFEWLHRQFIKIDCKHRNVTPDVAVPNRGEIEEFLHDERSLT